jgi:hypothetical protein
MVSFPAAGGQRTVSLAGRIYWLLCQMSGGYDEADVEDQF